MQLEVILPLVAYLVVASGSRFTLCASVPPAPF